MTLPQPWNVLKGDMNRVGLRPPLAGEVAGHALWHRRRLAVRNRGRRSLVSFADRDATLRLVTYRRNTKAQEEATVPTLRIPAFIFAIVLAIAACSGAASPTAPATAPSTAASAQASAGGSGSKAVDIKNSAFNPATITVKAGDTVTWTNNDGFAHTVTLDDNSVDSGNLNAGATFDHAFAAAGTFAYHCKIHASMHGTVTVTP